MRALEREVGKVLTRFQTMARNDARRIEQSFIKALASIRPRRPFCEPTPLTDAAKAALAREVGKVKARAKLMGWLEPRKPLLEVYGYFDPALAGDPWSDVVVCDDHRNYVRAKALGIPQERIRPGQRKVLVIVLDVDDR